MGFFCLEKYVTFAKCLAIRFCLQTEILESLDITNGAKGIRTPDPHTASVNKPSKAIFYFSSAKPIYRYIGAFEPPTKKN